MSKSNNIYTIISKKCQFYFLEKNIDKSYTICYTCNSLWSKDFV